MARALNNAAGMNRTRRNHANQPAWTGMAFMIEAMVLLLVVVISLAVFMQLFGFAQTQGRNSVKLEQAVVLAANSAEEFAANPDQLPEMQASGDLVAVTEVNRQKTEGGTLYKAVIAVNDQAGEQIYSVETSRYVSDTAADAQAEYNWEDELPTLDENDIDPVTGTARGAGSGMLDDGFGSEVS